MFDIGWTELLVVAAIAIIVVGPKDLPRMLRTFGQTVGKLRRMANEFQSTFNDALREAEKQADVDEMRKQVEAAGNFDPLGDLKKSIEPVKKAGDELREDVNKRIETDTPPSKPAPSDTASASTTSTSEPPAAPADETSPEPMASAPPEPAAKAAAAKPTAKAAPAKSTSSKPAASKPAAKKAAPRKTAAATSEAKPAVTKPAAAKPSAAKPKTTRSKPAAKKTAKAPAATGGDAGSEA